MSADDNIIPPPARDDLAMPPDYDAGDEGECPNCGGEGYTWGCFEDCCVCTDDDGLGCDPIRCDWCNPPKPRAAQNGGGA